MYGPGQIVYDLENKRPIAVGNDVWDANNPAYIVRTTHFIRYFKHMSEMAPGGLFLTSYEIFCPKSIEQAQALLDKNLIAPSPQNFDTHCWKCGNWYTNCNALKECSEAGTDRSLLWHP